MILFEDHWYYFGDLIGKCLIPKGLFHNYLPKSRFLGFLRRNNTIKKKKKKNK